MEISRWWSEARRSTESSKVSPMGMDSCSACSIPVRATPSKPTAEMESTMVGRRATSACRRTPTAAANADPDGDGRNNFFEFLSGFDPTSAASFFRFAVIGFSGPSVLDFRLNKVIPGRTYTLRESPNLIAPFVPVGSFSVSSEETNKLVQDTAAPAGRNFYQIEIAKP